MPSKVTKKIFLDKLKKDETLSADLRSKFQKQIEKMRDEEFDVFLESMKGINNKEDSENKIAANLKAQKANSSKIIQLANNFLKKATKHRAKKQEVEDNLKIETLRQKIKSM